MRVALANRSGLAAPQAGSPRPPEVVEDQVGPLHFESLQGLSEVGGVARDRVGKVRRLVGPSVSVGGRLSGPLPSVVATRRYTSPGPATHRLGSP